MDTVVGGGVPYVTNMFKIIAFRVLITTVTIVVTLICTTRSHLHIFCSIMSYFPRSPSVYAKRPSACGRLVYGAWGQRRQRSHMGLQGSLRIQCSPTPFLARFGKVYKKWTEKCPQILGFIETFVFFFKN